jgi:hypothetical protein
MSLAMSGGVIGLRSFRRRRRGSALSVVSLHADGASTHSISQATHASSNRLLNDVKSKVTVGDGD